MRRFVRLSSLPEASQRPSVTKLEAANPLR